MLVFSNIRNTFFLLLSSLSTIQYNIRCTFFVGSLSFMYFKLVYHSFDIIENDTKSPKIFMETE